MSKTYGGKGRPREKEEGRKPSVFERLGVRSGGSSGSTKAPSFWLPDQPPPQHIHQRFGSSKPPPSPLLPEEGKKKRKDKGVGKVAKGHGPERVKKTSPKKGKKQRQEREKERRGSSLSSSDEEESISSSSSSSTTSSSSTSVSSSSDSSVPSVKLRPKKKKAKDKDDAPDLREKLNAAKKKSMSPVPKKRAPPEDSEEGYPEEKRRRVHPHHHQEEVEVAVRRAPPQHQHPGDSRKDMQGGKGPGQGQMEHDRRLYQSQGQGGRGRHHEYDRGQPKERRSGAYDREPSRPVNDYRRPGPSAPGRSAATGRQPLLDFPRESHPHSHNYPQQDRYAPHNARFSEERERSLPLARQPLIPKSKEALAERYSEQMKKSGYYVDKWVDETLKATQSHKVAPLSEEGLASPSLTSTPKSFVSEDQQLKEKLVEPLLPVPDDLSDFSDDADELLKCESETSEKVSAAEVAHVSLPVKNKDQQAIQKPVIQPAQEMVSLSQVQASLPSQSQTDDDILERMDFEEISDEELEAGESNKIRIVDALGVDWASLVCQKEEGNPAVSEQICPLLNSARRRWRPANVFSTMRLSKNLLGDALYDRLKAEQSEVSRSSSGEMDKDRLAFEKIGIGPDSRALSARRELAFRRHLLNLPPRPLTALEMFQPNPSSYHEKENSGELLQLSLQLLQSTAS